jgi:hypothetical protein
MIDKNINSAFWVKPSIENDDLSIISEEDFTFKILMTFTGVFAKLIPLFLLLLRFIKKINTCNLRYSRSQYY